MRRIYLLSLLCLMVFTFIPALLNAQPELRQAGKATQLFVKGEPVLMLGVETTNKLMDKPEDLQYLDENLDMYKAAGVNTLVQPFAWYTLEPEQGTFDYTMIDAFIEACRERDMMLIPLWFGSIKNAQLSYAPDWVRENDDKFFRALREDGTRLNSISPFCMEGMKADRNAFQHLMQRIKEKDPEGEIVVMVQPNNETGIIATDSHRDMSEAATDAWNDEVPDKLMDYLEEHDGSLKPWLQRVWNENGRKSDGIWPEVFGEDSPGHKIFMSYYMAKYMGKIVEGGKEVYYIPMFVNDWLGSLKEPGGPIGGPDFQVHDIWRAVAPVIDIYAPDIYSPHYREFCDAFHYEDNPLVVPEAVGKHGARGKAGAQAWYTFVEHDGLLYSPYLNIMDEYNPDPANSAPYFKMNHLNKSYPLIAGMKDLLIEKQQSREKEMTAFLMNDNEDKDTTYKAHLKGLEITATPRIEWPGEEEGGELVTPFAVVIWLRQNEFLIIGTKMKLQFSRQGEDVEVGEAQLGRYVDDEWVAQNHARFTKADGRIEYLFPKGNLEVEEVRFSIK